VVVEAGSVLVDEATVEVVIGSVVVVAALLVVAADVVVSETSNASSLVTHPTTNDLRRVPSPTSVRLNLILVIGSFWFFGARAPLFQAVLHAAHDLRLTHVHASLRPNHISSTTLLHSTRRRVAALGLLQVSFSLASHLPAALTRLPTSQVSPQVQKQPTTLRVASRSSSATADETALHTSRLPSPHVRFSASLASDQHFSVRVHALRPSVRPSVRPSIDHSLLARRHHVRQRADATTNVTRLNAVGLMRSEQTWRCARHSSRSRRHDWCRARLLQCAGRGGWCGRRGRFRARRRSDR
jgi:hypothetical protein